MVKIRLYAGNSLEPSNTNDIVTGKNFKDWTISRKPTR
jgi:hypothetical protein